MVEDTRLLSTNRIPASGEQDAEEKEVQTLAQVPLGDNVRAPGSDVRLGELVLQKTEILQGAGGEIGTLAFVGRKEVCHPSFLFFSYFVCIYLSPPSAIGECLPQTSRRTSQYGQRTHRYPNDNE